MYITTVLTLAALLSVGSCGAIDPHAWRAPLPGDRRSPCPMMNTLANHGFVARSGRNISVDELVNAIDVAVNLSPLSSRPVVEIAASLSTTGYPNTFNLDDLNTHGAIEHDGSLSRADTITGDNHSFNCTIYNTVAAFFTQGTISIETAARARRARLTAAAAQNPSFTFTAREEQFSQFETALYLAVFGKGTKGGAKTSWVNILFREERLAYDEGFKRAKDVITNDDVVELAGKVAAAA
ncbi:Chloroperoxidase [Staphylotrichum tortipilum]|uniref:Chloroperoxidase n=1 Tax=Staphylotrichum tortipilum TaxID=2831512 RepID=A0AAN6RRQ9_9PEZI|nr:Chloroperoxidase [Staphylotrichum longicolle]